jgi:hypothetical protein
MSVLDSLPRSFTLALGATLALTAIVVIPSSLGAQQAADAPAPPPAAAPPRIGSGYTYDASGRRDPFMALDHAVGPARHRPAR